MDKKTHPGHEGHAVHERPAPPGAEGLKDPVCGMTVTDHSPHVLEYAGTRVYFCSAGCKTEIAANPAQYRTASAAVAAPPFPVPEPVAAGTVYTCPMHHEVRQDRHGACPKCGMALEPEMPTLDDGESPELLDFKRWFVWMLPLTIIVTVLAMAGHRLQWFEKATQSWLELVLTAHRDATDAGIDAGAEREVDARELAREV